MDASDQPVSPLSRLEWTLLRPDIHRDEIQQCCQNAAALGIYGVCVTSGRTELASLMLEDAEVRVVTVLGFPFGTMDPDVKRYEAEVAIDLGAQELALIVSPTPLREGAEKALFREFRDVVEVAEILPVRAVMARGLFDANEERAVMELARESGISRIELVAGLHGDAPDLEDVRRLRQVSADGFRFKVTGPFVDADDVATLLDEGVDWVGVPDPRRIAASWQEDGL